MTEAGLRKVFRVHRSRTGATRVRPHRLRHTYANRAGRGRDRPAGVARVDGACLAGDHGAVRAPGAGDAGGRVRRRPGGDRAMTVIEHDLSVAAVERPVGLIDAYAAAQHGVGRHRRVSTVAPRAARRFLADHPDSGRVDVPARWRSGSLTRRARRRCGRWSPFALISTRVQADAEFLLVKGLRSLHAPMGDGALPARDPTVARRRRRLGVSEHRANGFIAEALAFVIAFTGKTPSGADRSRILTVASLPSRARRSASSSRRCFAESHASMFGLRKLLFEAGLVDCPPVRRRVRRAAHPSGPPRRRSPPPRSVTPSLAYLDARSARAAPQDDRQADQRPGVFGEFLTNEFPELASIAKLERRHVEAFLAWTATRTVPQATTATGPSARSSPPTRRSASAGFFDDITAWGWPQAPARQLMFTSDIPKQPTLLPRAARPRRRHRVDGRRRRTGRPVRPRRVDRSCAAPVCASASCSTSSSTPSSTSARPGSWVRVPLGKLNTERMVPLDATTLAALDDWLAHRRHQRALPHPATDDPPTSCSSKTAAASARRPQQGLRDAGRRSRAHRARRATTARSSLTSSATPTPPPSSTPACRSRP